MLFLYLLTAFVKKQKRGEKNSLQHVMKREIEEENPIVSNKLDYRPRRNQISWNLHLLPLICLLL
jgi:hypothetical protein